MEVKGGIFRRGIVELREWKYLAQHGAWGTRWICSDAQGKKRNYLMKEFFKIIKIWGRILIYKIRFGLKAWFLLFCTTLLEINDFCFGWLSLQHNQTSSTWFNQVILSSFPWNFSLLLRNLFWNSSTSIHSCVVTSHFVPRRMKTLADA